MNDRQYFLMTSLSYQLKAAQQELSSFRSGEAYVKLRADYENLIRSKDLTIKRLQKERDDFSFSRKEITRQWMEVLEDVQKEHEKEEAKLKKVIAELLDMVASLKNRNAELDEKRKKALEDYYETAAKLEDAQGLIIKLTAQVNHNYENSSLPSSKCIKRKKITNNREKTGKKPGAQVGHPHHPRKPMKPDQVVEIPTEEKFKDRSRYVPAQTTVSRQVIGIRVIPVVTEYRAVEFYDKKKGRKVHSAFPYGVADDVNYDESMKAVLFLLNSRCSVSLEKTAQFVSNVTEGALSPSVGMIARYDAVVQTAAQEYGDEPPSDYYRNGYNLYLRMVEYKHNHLLFLSNPLVEPDNNLCERKARKGVFKRKKPIQLKTKKPKPSDITLSENRTK